VANNDSKNERTRIIAHCQKIFLWEKLRLWGLPSTLKFLIRARVSCVFRPIEVLRSHCPQLFDSRL